MRVWTITGADMHREHSKQLRIFRVLLESAQGGVLVLKDWQIAKASGVNPRRINTTLREMELAGILTRETRDVPPPEGHEGYYKERRILLHFDAVRELPDRATLFEGAPR